MTCALLPNLYFAQVDNNPPPFYFHHSSQILASSFCFLACLLPFRYRASSMSGDTFLSLAPPLVCVQCLESGAGWPSPWQRCGVENGAQWLHRAKCSQVRRQPQTPQQLGGRRGSCGKTGPLKLGLRTFRAACASVNLVFQLVSL